MGKLTQDHAQQFFERYFGEKRLTTKIALFGQGGWGKTTLSRELSSGCALELLAASNDLGRFIPSHKVSRDTGRVLLVDLDFMKPNQHTVNRAVLPEGAKRYTDPNGRKELPTWYHMVKDPSIAVEDLVVQSTVPGYHLILGDNNQRQKSGVSPEFVERVRSGLSAIANSGKYNFVMLNVAGSNGHEIDPFINMADQKIGVTGAESLSMTEVLNTAYSDIFFSIREGFERFFERKFVDAQSKEGQEGLVAKLGELQTDVNDLLANNKDNIDGLYESVRDLGDKKTRGEMLNVVKDAINRAVYGLVFSRIDNPSEYKRNFTELEEDLLRVSSKIDPGVRVHNLNGWGYTPNQRLVVESTNNGVPLIVAKHAPVLIPSSSKIDIDYFHREAKTSDFVGRIEGMVDFLVYNPVNHLEVDPSGYVGLKRRSGEVERL